jgi:single-stranded-DNA-specific exonuclease
MIPDHKYWQIDSPISPEAENSLRDFPRIVRQILYNRGIGTKTAATRFLSAEVPEELIGAQILGLDEAIQRISYAIRSQELIAVYGDYDVDGVTATALMTLALEMMGANVRPYIPNRFDEGYGLNLEAIKSLKQENVGLIITVDCGIRSPDEIAYANTLGIDVIISDHHQPGNQIPDALTIINPKRDGDTYPDKDLAGVGLAFKIVDALIQFMEARHLTSESFLDLVALGTIADLAPLTGENRFLVRKGLQVLRNTERQGLLSLMVVAGVKPDKLTATDIGFSIGPRLNASGRLDSAIASLHLLTTRDVFEAGKLAQQLEIQNRDRQRITKEIQSQAEALAFEENQDPLLLFACHTDFNPGVVGLAASRLSETYYRPAIVAHIGETETRGSCRSIKEFHITEALDQCQDLLVRHGGHAAAAGFTVENANLNALKQRLLDIAHHQLKNIDLKPTLIADIEIPLHDLRPDLLSYLLRLEPTGYGNRQPHFVSRDLFVDLDPKRTRRVGADGSHLKLVVTDGLVTFDAIAFRLGDWYEHLHRKIDLLYTFEVNEFNGRTSLQLNVKDIRSSS